MVWDENAGALAAYDAEGVEPALDHEATIDGERYATVFTLLKEGQAQYTPSWAAQTTGIDEGVLVEITDKYANHGPSILSFGFGGGEKFYNADVAGHAAVLLATLVGSFGTDVPGWGAGAYVNAYQKIFGAGKFANWPLPSECKTASAPKASTDYRDEESNIHFMWVQNGAFQQIAGNQNRTNEWAKTLDFVVVQDIWHTPSVDWADIVLPDLTPQETYSLTGAGEACDVAGVRFGQPVYEPKFERREIYEVCGELAKRLGVYDEYSEGGLTREDWCRKLYDELVEEAGEDYDLPTYDEGVAMGTFTYDIEPSS